MAVLKNKGKIRVGDKIGDRGIFQVFKDVLCHANQDTFNWYMSSYIDEQGAVGGLIFICVMVAALFFLKNLTLRMKKDPAQNKSFQAWGDFTLKGQTYFLWGAQTKGPKAAGRAASRSATA